MEKNMREKQKLVGRNTYTPTDAPQVRSSVTLSLNREETLSEQSLKTPSNNPHVDLQSGMTGWDLKVPVINMRNEPLMPTTPGKARKLLKQNKARVISSSGYYKCVIVVSFIQSHGNTILLCDESQCMF